MLATGTTDDNIAQAVIDAGESGLWRQLEPLLAARVRADPQDAKALERLALVTRQQGNLGRAAELYAELVRLEPGNVSARILSDVCRGAPSRLAPSPNDICAAPFVYKKNFLSPAQHASLFDLLEEQMDNLEELDVNSIGVDGTHKAQRDNKIRLQFGVYCQEQLRKIVQPEIQSRMPAILKALHIEPFKAGQHTMRLDVTPDGGFGRMHQDVGFGARVAYLYYFHECPKKFTGGDFLLFDQHVATNRPVQDQFTRFVQKDNTLVVFAPHYFHQVTRTTALSPPLARQDARLSVCGFIHCAEQD